LCSGGISLPTTLTAGQEIGPGAILFVVHTWFVDKKGEEIIRLIGREIALRDADPARSAMMSLIR
jgi:hypothetical protein